MQFTRMCITCSSNVRGKNLFSELLFIQSYLFCTKTPLPFYKVCSYNRGYTIFLKELFSYFLSGNPEPEPCPAGSYCEEGTGPIDCPRLHYRDIVGGANLSDCFPCEPGFWCNVTGIADYTWAPCPVGHYCEEASEPALCPAGRYRTEVGARNYTDCPLCPDGFYCPNDTVNTMGIPCEETFECPEGTAIPMECRAGLYCPRMTGWGLNCTAGYYCPNATGSHPYLCTYPYTCPTGAKEPEICALGYKAIYRSTLRTGPEYDCIECESGTYSNSSTRKYCEPCPAGYYCPKGQGFPTICPKGSYCPAMIESPYPCHPGQYGLIERATTSSECEPCPASHYNNEYGKEKCKLCGSSSSSDPGSSECTCRGSNRVFQPSNGYCTCKSGYCYFDELDTGKSDGDGKQDCQPCVDVKCSTHEVRIAATRGCGDPSTYSCATPCLGSTGSLSESLGM